MKKLLFLYMTLSIILLSACSQSPPQTDIPSSNPISTVKEPPAFGTNEPTSPGTGANEFCSQPGNEPFVEEVTATTGTTAAQEAPVTTGIPHTTTEDRAVDKTVTVTEPPEIRQPVETGHSEPAEITNEEPKPTEQALPPVIETAPDPIPEQTTEPVQPAKPAFDVSSYVAYAKSCGQSLGLTLDSTAVSCWDDPLTANASCIYLERDIRDRLDWYAVSGFTAFWVWSEDLGGGNYLVYIGYA